MRAQSEHRVNDRAVKVRRGPKLVRRIREAIRAVASVLAEMTGSRTEKDYVVRPWTEDENADFARFCASLDENPIDPGFDPDAVEIMSHDPWYDMELPRA